MIEHKLCMNILLSDTYTDSENSLVCNNMLDYNLKKNLNFKYKINKKLVFYPLKNY